MKKMASNTGAAAGGAEAEGSHFRLEKKNVSGDDWTRSCPTSAIKSW